MRISGPIISKILMLCGIALTCTACYAAPSTDYRPPQASEETAVNGEIAADEDARIAPEIITGTVHEK